ncbi:MAG: DUF1499 domain-containing protein [Neptuniibacter sp.]
MPKLGIENGQFMACPSSPNCVCSQAGDEAHFIQPIKTTGPTSTVKNTLLKILNGSARTTVTQTEDNYIRAEFVSRFFRFVDDVEFLILEMSPDETVVHVRSASRVGHSDFGVNRKRVEKIRDQFTAMNKEH